MDWECLEFELECFTFQKALTLRQNNLFKKVNSPKQKNLPTYSGDDFNHAPNKNSLMKTTCDGSWIKSISMQNKFCWTLTTAKCFSAVLPDATANNFFVSRVRKSLNEARMAALIVVINWTIRSVHNTIRSTHRNAGNSACEKSCNFDSSRFDLSRAEK